MEFEWDEIKNETNKRKHGISFEMASLVFNDVNRIEKYDARHSKINEDRYITIGKVNKVLFVVFTELEDNVRIISARIAKKKEKEIYYGNSSLPS